MSITHTRRDFSTLFGVDFLWRHRWITSGMGLSHPPGWDNISPDTKIGRNSCLKSEKTFPQICKYWIHICTKWEKNLCHVIRYLNCFSLHFLQADIPLVHQHWFNDVATSAERQKRSTEGCSKFKYRGMFEIQKSGDKTSSGEIGLDIRTYASPKVGQDQVSGGVSVLCWHAASVAYVLWKPCTIR